MAHDRADEEMPVADCWDYEMDGKLVFHSCTYESEERHDPLWRVTIEFTPRGRRQLTDAGCRRLAEGLVREQRTAEI